MAEDNAVLVKIRLPSGASLEGSFTSASTLKEVNEWLQAQSGETDLLLSLPHPRKVYDKTEQATTALSDIPGFGKKGLLIAQRGIATDMKQDTTPYQKPGVIHITSEAEYEKWKATSSTKLVVADFSAEWCGPCKKIAPIYEALAAATPSVTFLHIDVDKVRPSDAANVSSIPTFLFFKKSQIVHEFSGADPSELQASVAKYK